MKLKYTCPKYPVYIISKNRHESMYTSRALTMMKVPHYIAIEPQNEEQYIQALKNFKLEEFATLRILPFSNHGLGPGVARNWCWEDSIQLGAERHWVMDDNIQYFARLYKNTKIRVGSGLIFKLAEDFCDRFENVKQAGLQYTMFSPAGEKRNPVSFNTRIYSCILLSNDIPHRWRGRYNEDTILSIDIMRDGWCTVEFNTFLQNKLPTQTVKGGNTQEFYTPQSELFETKAERDATKVVGRDDGNVMGTYEKSKMLVDTYPQYCKLVYKYGRIHHEVDYSSFKKNKLKLKPGVKIPSDFNNHGLFIFDKDTGKEVVL